MSRKVPILLYHRVGHRDGSFMDRYTVSPGRFAEQMDAIKRYGWRPTTLENALDRKVRNNASRSLVITFDDGFASNREHAWPVLERHSFPSDTFVVTGCLGLYNIWDGARRASYPLLSVKDLAAANPALMKFHSHSENHPDLTFLTHDPEALKREIDAPRRSLLSYRQPANSLHTRAAPGIGKYWSMSAIPDTRGLARAWKDSTRPAPTPICCAVSRSTNTIWDGGYGRRFF